MATVVADTPARKRRPKIAPTPFERGLALGAGLMFAALLAALARGFGDWSRVPALIWFHLATIAVGLALTPIILLGKCGSPWHRRLGYVWAAAMIATALATFGIRRDSDGSLSPIHLLSVLTLVQLPRAIWAARRHKVDQHRRNLQLFVLGALVLAGHSPWSRVAPWAAGYWADPLAHPCYGCAQEDEAMHASLPFAAAISLALTPARPVPAAQPSVPPAPARALSPTMSGDDGVACRPLSRHARGDERPGARKLIDAPPADLHLAVDRRVNGCPVPALAGARPR